MSRSTSAIQSPQESGGRIQRQKLRVPRTNQTLFALPAQDAVAELVRQNQSIFANVDVPVQGRGLVELRHQSRQRIVQGAREYLSRLGFDSADVSHEVPLLVGGHQPALFHPGVWAKNFSLAASARRMNGLALNLVIDNDTINSSGIKVPAGTRANPHLKTIAFDAERTAEPWEDAQVMKASQFESFAARCANHMRPWNISPIIQNAWPSAVQTAKKTQSLRDALTVARVSLERELGLQNLELPLSHLCVTEPFLRFASHILAHLPRFLSIHNQVLGEYRVANRVRSKTHPVPELVEKDGWLEAPFWMWRAGDKQRRHVFARQLEKTIELSDGIATFAELPLTPEMDACCAIEALQEIQCQGIRFRTRALTTTLFARLFLSDLFVHGIGGAKYDEMTDRIIEEFFGIVPPAFQVVSATLHVPFAEPFSTTSADIREMRAELRDLKFNPQRHIANAEFDTAGLVTEKRALIEAENNKQLGRLHRGENYDRYRRLLEINRQLFAATTEKRAALESDIAQASAEFHANSIIQNREFSFAMFPESTLREFFRRVE